MFAELVVEQSWRRRCSQKSILSRSGTRLGGTEVGRVAPVLSQANALFRGVPHRFRAGHLTLDANSPPLAGDPLISGFTTSSPRRIDITPQERLM